MKRPSGVPFGGTLVIVAVTVVVVLSACTGSQPGADQTAPQGAEPSGGNASEQTAQQAPQPVGGSSSDETARTALPLDDGGTAGATAPSALQPDDSGTAETTAQTAAQPDDGGTAEATPQTAPQPGDGGTAEPTAQTAPQPDDGGTAEATEQTAPQPDDGGTAEATFLGAADEGSKESDRIEHAGSSFTIVEVLPRDRILAIFDPVFMSAEAAADSISERDLVIGLSINGDHRAYSLPFLSRHEIVNDVVGGKPVAVTW